MVCGEIGNGYIAYIDDYLNKEKGGLPYKDPKTGETGTVKVKLLWADTRYELPLIKSSYRHFVDQGVVLVFTMASPVTEMLPLAADSSVMTDGAKALKRTAPARKMGKAFIGSTS